MLAQWFQRWRQAGHACHAEVLRGSGSADIHKLVKQVRPSSRKFVDADEKNCLELKTLDVLDVEYSDVAFLADGLTFVAGNDLDILLDQGIVQGLGEGREAEIQWTAEASTRLEKIPEFARPMARQGIERFAKERGFSRVDAVVLDQAKDFFGM